MSDFNFTPFPQLTTTRLVLRQLTEEDAAIVFFLRSDERVLKYLHREPAASIPEVMTFISKVNENVAANENPYWAIALKEQPNQLIGTICLWNIRKENYRAELGYVLHPDYWGKQIMREAMQEVIAFGFEQLHLHSIDAVVNPGNVSSIKNLEALGFIKEAHFKEDTHYKGRFYDTAVYSLLNKA